MMPIGLHKDQGFSLVEVMVATVVFALISSAGVIILSQYQDTRVSLQAADERLASLEMMRATLRRDLAATVLRPVRDAYGGAQTGFEGGIGLADGGLLKLVRADSIGARIAGGSSELQRVEYAIKDQSLIRRIYTHTDITLDTPSREQVLFSGIESANLRFEADGIWSEEWRGDVGAVALANLVEFQFTMIGAQTLTMTFPVGGAS